MKLFKENIAIHDYYYAKRKFVFHPTTCDYQFKFKLIIRFIV